jgi:oxygen-independent coproporphyrinogen-3 oxidase
MQLRANEAGTGSIDTIYFGGGTPSQLTAEQLRQLFDILHKYNKVSEDAEITIECNPDDVTPSLAAMLPQTGFNRVSMGVQTFDDGRLRFLHRRHTSTQVSVAVSWLRDAGIGNISIDLMYGFPGETTDDWQHDIDAALSLGVEHVSAYCLMIEENTPLWKQMNNGTLLPVDEELERQMYEVLIDRLTAAGYEHYEISNFARPGYRSLHNSSYWQDVPYIGLGAAAHSYDGTARQWNVADVHAYMERVERGEVPCEREVIDGDTRYNDRITVALRTYDGLDLTTLSSHHRNHCLKEAQRFIADGLLRLQDNRLVLTRRGLFVSDYIMSSLVYV